MEILERDVYQLTKLSLTQVDEYNFHKIINRLSTPWPKALAHTRLMLDTRDSHTRAREQRLLANLLESW